MPALVLGLAVMLAHSAPRSLPAINAVSAIVATALLLLAGRRLAACIVGWPGWVGSAVLLLGASTLLAPGIDGVHRWISPGGVRLHPAALTDPLLLLAIITLALQQRARAALALLAAGEVLRTLQPDAGQASALAAGSMAIALLSTWGRAERLALLVVALGGSAVAWLQPDPLPPVDMVENIVPRAFEIHPLVGVLCLAGLALLPAAALWPAPSGERRKEQWLVPSAGVALYLSTSSLVVFFGEFPTPVLGFGASPVVGAILGLGLLAGVRACPPRRSSLRLDSAAVS